MVGFLGTGSKSSPATDSRHPVASVPHHADGSATHLSPGSSASKSLSADHHNDARHGPLHFFSLPHWTRKILPISASARRSLGVMPSDELGVVSRSSNLMLDKELPPTPPKVQTVPCNPDHMAVSLSQPISPPTSMNQSTRLSTVSGTNIPSTSTSAEQPTMYFDVYHNTPYVSVPHGVNTVSFVTPSSTDIDQCDSTLPLRQSRSSQSFRADKQSTRPLSGADRVRGLSIGQRLRSSKRPEPKYTELLIGGKTEGPPNRPILSKKSSGHLLSVPPDPLSLPALQPTSPFRVDFQSDTLTSSQQSPQRSASRLTRSKSERVFRRSPPSNSDIPTLSKIPSAFTSSNVHSTTGNPICFLPSPRPAPRRPATADSTRSRTRSFFTLSSQATPVPSNQTPHYENALSSLISPISVNSTNNRPRSVTNPPLLHRLSLNFFASSTSPTKAGIAPDRFITASPVSRTRPSLLSSVPPEDLRPHQEELPESFLQRLTSLVGKADIAGLLASSAEVKYVATLKLYIGKFSFDGDSLDVALRRLLMHIGLPRETQQIDRVMEAFSKRYVECNPGVFLSDDIPYILAFSLIMLHTDAFNKSNKRKMTKTDYLKNTAISGVFPEVLDCFYDNIVFAPFIFIEDSMESPHPPVDGGFSRPPTSTGLPTTPTGGTLLTRPKIDPYYLITNHLLDSLRVNVEQYIPLDNPYCWEGTGGSWDHDELWSAFQANTVDITTSFDHNRLPAGLFGLSVGGIPGPTIMGTTSHPGLLSPQKETWRLKLSKISVLNRKDDILEGGKKISNRKWKTFGAALTSSQVILFRDPSWATMLLSSDVPRNSSVQMALSKPDEVLSIKGAVAVFDRSYQKHPNIFRLTLADGRQILFQTSDELDVNQWVSRINYASAFKSAGIRMRPPGMLGREVKLTGLAAAQSHLQDLRAAQQSQPIRSWGSESSLSHSPKSTEEGSEDVMKHDPEFGAKYIIQQDNTYEPPIVREIEGASQFKATFDKVKEELAAARCESSLLPNDAGGVTVRHSSPMIDDNSPPLSNRTILLRSTIDDLEERICVAQPLLEAKMHFARNVSVLTPFQRSTRDRLQDAVQNAAKQISHLRLEIARLICHRNILLNDVAAEERGFKQATVVALKAAMETLQSKGQFVPESTSLSTVTVDISSQHLSSKTTPDSVESSTHDSFRSALDFGPDWPASWSTDRTSSVSNISQLKTTTDFPLAEGGSGYLFLDADTSLVESQTPRSIQSSLELSFQDSKPHSVHEKFYTAQESPEEQAEEWNKTRAAKRVSLVKLPPDIQLSTRFGKTQWSSCNDLISTVTREDAPFQ